ncbi:hypothetical protein D1AOALGA4SA_10862 [Olavius algarvensis Delta 1 endosymbiont]|nr:hypothetical protein D1AOALGA4SA_10862 [Olavius algarvensis Delta 1 endosymbiont]
MSWMNFEDGGEISIRQSGNLNINNNVFVSIFRFQVSGFGCQD